MINAYLIDTVKFIRPMKDKRGQTISETVVEVPARKVYKVRRMIGNAGEEVQSELTIMVQDRDADLAELVETDGQRWAILAIKRKRDFSWGFMEVMLGARTGI